MENASVLDVEIFNEELRRTLLPVTTYIGIEAVFGFFGNLLVLLVFKFRYHSCNFRYFVLCLALTDVIASSTAIAGEVVTQTYWYNYTFPAVCKIKSFFNVFTVFAEAYCLLTIAVDRYRKVCRPLGWQITPRISIIICIVIYIVSTIIAMPVAFLWGTHVDVLNRTDITVGGYKPGDHVQIHVSICEIDQNYVGQSEPKTYTHCLEGIISMSLVPMFILYILVAKTLIGSSKELEKHRSSMTARNNNRRFPKHDDRSDTDYRTDDDSNAYSAHSPVPGPKPSKSLHLKVPDMDFDSSTVNSMTTTHSGTASTDLDKTEKRPVKQRPKRHKKSGKMVSSRVRRKTLIMFVLTVIFMITTITYLTMLGLIAGDILDTLTNGQKALYFFGFRFYFINHVINPLVYGLLDPQFRRVISEVVKKIKGSCYSR